MVPSAKILSHTYYHDLREVENQTHYLHKIISDGIRPSCLKVLKDRCERTNTILIEGERLKHIGGTQWLKRFIKEALALESDYIVKVDPDTLFNPHLELPNPQGIAAKWYNNSLIHTGCAVFNRQALIRIQDSNILDDPKYNSDCFRYTKWSIFPTGNYPTTKQDRETKFSSSDLVLTDVCKELNIPLDDWSHPSILHPNPHYRYPKVVNFGIGRTGTTSLSAAMYHLGYETTECLTNLDDIHSLHYISDGLTSINLDYITNLYPDCLLIWTNREKVSWMKSAKYRFTQPPPHSIYKDIRIQLYGSEYFDEELYSKAYDRNVELYKRVAQYRTVLTFNLFQGDGWSKLCDFLYKPIPQLPFPHLNCSQ